MKKSKIKALTEISLFVAILSVISQISIPVGVVPITLQIFFICIMGYFLGLKKGLCCILVYILLGMVGLPIFSGFRGGFYVIFSYTGGFILGFVPLTISCGIFKARKIGILSGIIGVIICHLMGILQYSIISQISFEKSFFVVSLPFILKDVLFAILGYFIAIKIKKALLI